MLRKHLWLGVLSVMAGMLCAYLQQPGGISAQSGTTTTPSTSTANSSNSSTAATGEATSSTATTSTGSTPSSGSASNESEQRLFAPQVWRLPDVTGGPAASSDWIAGPSSTSYQPPALTVTPLESVPVPVAEEEKPPKFNAPMSLSGVLSDGLRVTPETPPPKTWTGSFTLGLDGSEGNTETMNFRFGFATSRKTELSVLTANVDYRKQSTGSTTTADRLNCDARGERLFKDAPWSLFVHETLEYDQFEPFDCRDTSDAGVGYRWIKNENTTFVTRFGGGFSHEYGGPDEGYIPELVFGIQVDHQISKRQKIVAVVEYAPDVANFARYRIRTQAAWDVLLDQERNLNLRVGVLERYNAQAGDNEPNDLDYALMLMWSF